ncbi:hypothetical protein [Methanobrevibacter millerae]|uniref:Right handed beta helix domain-containing protein n=1 Tax=Methanobrevibacter millerae TaxID=230361 RepID=A0A1G5XL89_9EURY|nr:hypothetical protein [Methanobrevibacter millerae]SDA71223.1 hypothetical protein SAMN02910315_02345 [Methanobrevibacter millerae]
MTINGHGHFFDGNGSKISNLFIAYGDNVVLKNITFINWNLEDYDGVILWGGLNGTIKDCTFKNNYALGGELIDWVGHEGLLINCDFINTTIESGSAIYWEGVAGYVLNCDFLNNTAETGGVIIWKGKTDR